MILVKVAIHQPNFLPYLGYFDKVRKADIFVILDDTQFSKNSFTNRNRIKTPIGVKWLTVPILRRKSKLPINEVMIENPLWVKKHTNIIHNSYHSAEYYSPIIIGLLDIFEKNYFHLDNLNKSLIYFALTLLGIDTKVVLSSSLNLDSTSTQKLIDICKAVGGDQYLAGRSGHKYMNDELFKENGIELLVHEFEHPVYKQLHGAFVPNLSVLDYLMNVGVEPFWSEFK